MGRGGEKADRHGEAPQGQVEEEDEEEPAHGAPPREQMKEAEKAGVGEGGQEDRQEAPEKVRALIEHELALIAELEVASYFLSVQQIVNLVDRYDARGGRFAGAKSGTTRHDDDNPFILRDYEQCISCYRCVRVCAEREGDYAISVMGRGFDTQITTEFGGLLRDSSCTFCGQCVQTCPTGALADRKALRAADLPGEIEKTRTVCPYCGVGCSVDVLSKGDQLVGVQPAMDGPANLGALCVKGQFAFDFVQHPDRLRQPMVRDGDGRLVETTWEVALDRAADGFRRARDRYGRHSVYAIASGRAPNEAAYAMQKFIRAGFGTNYIDNCSRA